MRFQVTVTVLALLTGLASAAFQQGLVDPHRDHLIKYDSSMFAETIDFCRAFAVAEGSSSVGAMGYHHQLDCVFDQPGPNVRAWCGGLKKDRNGKWNNKDTPETFTTKVLLSVRGNNVIVGYPVPAGKGPAKRNVKVPAGKSYKTFRSQWKAACGTYVSALTEGAGQTRWRCVQPKNGVAQVTCGSRVGSVETDVTDALVGNLNLQNA